MTALDPSRVLTTGQRRKPGAAPRPPEAIDKETLETATAKVSMGNNSAASSAASVVTSFQQRDALQASADVLKLSGATLAKVGPAANNLSVGGNLIASVNKAAQGDSFSAAQAASLAVDKLSPELAKSPVGAVANAVVLTTSPEKLKATKATLQKAATRASNPNVPFFQRVKATLDLTSAVQQLASVGQTIGNAGWKLAGFAIDKLTRVASAAPAAFKAQSVIGKVATSPLGKSFGFLNKWIPLLNVAGVALSGKTAVDVFRHDKSSTTSKTLAVASVGTAVAGLVAGFSLGFLPFLGVIGASILTDVALSKSRKRDADHQDTDTQIQAELQHPVQATGKLIRWSGREIVKLGEVAANAVTDAFGKLKARLAPHS